MAAIVVLSGVALASCSPDTAPGRLSADVSRLDVFSRGAGPLLVARCGSIDCHGSVYRNYRIFGYGGARLDPTHRPDAPDTTNEELSLDYDATVGVEPERTRAVAKGSEPPERMTLVRKARNSEEHVGGERLPKGSAGDKCLVGFLRDEPDKDACVDALDEYAPKP